MEAVAGLHDGHRNEARQEPSSVTAPSASGYVSVEAVSSHVAISSSSWPAMSSSTAYQLAVPSMSSWSSSQPPVTSMSSWSSSQPAVPSMSSWSSSQPVVPSMSSWSTSSQPAMSSSSSMLSWSLSSCSICSWASCPPSPQCGTSSPVIIGPSGSQTPSLSSSFVSPSGSVTIILPSSSSSIDPTSAPPSHLPTSSQVMIQLSSSTSIAPSSTPVPPSTSSQVVIQAVLSSSVSGSFTLIIPSTSTPASSHSSSTLATPTTSSSRATNSHIAGPDQFGNTANDITQNLSDQYVMSAASMTGIVIGGSIIATLIAFIILVGFRRRQEDRPIFSFPRSRRKTQRPRNSRMYDPIQPSSDRGPTDAIAATIPRRGQDRPDTAEMSSGPRSPYVREPGPPRSSSPLMVYG